MVPMNSATNGVAGLPYISAGEPICSILPFHMHRDAVGDRERLLLVVRHVQRRDPELELDAPDLLAQLHAHLRVERRERLVEQQHLRLDRERARERDSLLHAARELVGIALRRVAEPDELEQLARPVLCDRPCACRRIRRPYSTFCSAVMFGNRL